MKILYSIFIIFITGSSYAQDALVDRLSKQAVVIDSLEKAIKLERSNALNNQITIKELLDIVKVKENVIIKLENIPNEVGRLQKEITSLEAELLNKSDSLTLLKLIISEKEEQIGIEKEESLVIAKEENENGKNEILTNVISKYKNKSFDDLLKFSVKEALEHDLILVGQTSEIEPLLSDMLVVFNVKDLLQNKFDFIKTESLQNRLDEIQRESASIDRVKENLRKYQMATDGLKETIGSILFLDQGETVSGMPRDIQKQKLNKILYQVSLYVFNFNLNFTDYPYLSEMVIKIIERKHPDPDANISDLLEKL